MTEKGTTVKDMEQLSLKVLNKKMYLAMFIMWVINCMIRIAASGIHKYMLLGFFVGAVILLIICQIGKGESWSGLVGIFSLLYATLNAFVMIKCLIHWNVVEMLYAVVAMVAYGYFGINRIDYFAERDKYSKANGTANGSPNGAG